jgi:membrane associated rhomboid family serine protease
MGIYDREYYRDETRGSGFLSGVAPACKTLILANVVVFVFQELTKVDAFGDGPILRWFAADSVEIFHHAQVWRLLTAPFLHANLFHLFFNMLLLWVFGRDMESMYGTREFTTMYLSAGTISTLCWAILDRFGPSPGHAQMIGASGAVTAVIVLYTLYYPHREILFFFILPVEMWLILIIYLGSDLLYLLNELRGFGGMSAGVAFASHLGGAAYGFLYKHYDLRWSRLLSDRRRRPRFRVVSAEPRDTVSPLSTTPSPTRTAAASGARPAPAFSFPEEQLDARLDEVLVKIAREGRDGLTEEEKRVLEEASRRARDRRSDRL